MANTTPTAHNKVVQRKKLEETLWELNEVKKSHEVGSFLLDFMATLPVCIHSTERNVLLCLMQQHKDLMLNTPPENIEVSKSDLHSK